MSPEDAEIIARADTGTGDLPRLLSTGMIIAMTAIILLRMILEMPLPSFKVLGAYAVALVAWISMLLYVRFRVKATAEEIKGKPFYLRVNGEGIAAGKFEDDLSYRALWDEIEVVEKGDRIYRITSPMGRLCLPRTALSSDERERLESLEAIIINRNWM